MTKSSTHNGDEGRPAYRIVNLRAAVGKSIRMIDLGDVAPIKPTNMNPFETAPPPAHPGLSDPPPRSTDGNPDGE